MKDLAVFHPNLGGSPMRTIATFFFSCLISFGLGATSASAEVKRAKIEQAKAVFAEMSADVRAWLAALDGFKKKLDKPGKRWRDVEVTHLRVWVSSGQMRCAYRALTEAERVVFVAEIDQNLLSDGIIMDVTGMMSFEDYLGAGKPLSPQARFETLLTESFREIDYMSVLLVPLEEELDRMSREEVDAMHEKAEKERGEIYRARKAEFRVRGLNPCGDK